MNRMKRILILSIACACCLSQTARAADKLNVVATTTTFADLVRRVGGERVSVEAVALPKFNVHFYAPKPSDVRKVSRADLYVSSGIDAEPWSDPLLEAAGKPALFRGGPRHVDLSRGIELADAPDRLTRDQGDIHAFGNPHFGVGPQFAARMAETIALKLKEADPAGASVYDANLAGFERELAERIAAWKNACSHCAGKEMVSYHEDIEYFADFLGVRVERFIEPKPGIPPTPRHLQELENYMDAKQVRAIAMTSYYPRGVAESVADRSGARIAVVAQNAGEIPGTEDYFSLIEKNVANVAEALR